MAIDFTAAHKYNSQDFISSHIDSNTAFFSPLVTMKPCSILKWCAIFSTTIHFVTSQSAQELINSILNPDPSKATYSSYSSKIYFNHTLYNTTAIASTNYERLEASARVRLPSAAFDYAAGGAGLEKTVAANREAFDKVSISFLVVSRQPLTIPSSGVSSPV
jgi:hypothetical protein